MSIINDDHELDKMLESTNLDKYKVIDLLMKQLNGLSHEYTGVEVAPTLDTESMTPSRKFNGTVFDS